MDKTIFKENNLFRFSILGLWFYLSTLSILVIGIYYNIDNKGPALHLLLAIFANHMLFGIYYVGNAYYHNVQDGCNNKYVTNKVHGRKQGILRPNTILSTNLVAFSYIVIILTNFSRGNIPAIISIVTIVMVPAFIARLSIELSDHRFSGKHKGTIYVTVGLQVLTAIIGIVFLPTIVSPILLYITAFTILLLGRSTRYV